MVIGASAEQNIFGREKGLKGMNNIGSETITICDQLDSREQEILLSKYPPRCKGRVSYVGTDSTHHNFKVVASVNGIGMECLHIIRRNEAT